MEDDPNRRQPKWKITKMVLLLLLKSLPRHKHKTQVQRRSHGQKHFTKFGSHTHPTNKRFGHFQGTQEASFVLTSVLGKCKVQVKAQAQSQVQVQAQAQV